MDHIIFHAKAQSRKERHQVFFAFSFADLRLCVKYLFTLALPHSISTGPSPESVARTRRKRLFLCQSDRQHQFQRGGSKSYQRIAEASRRLLLDALSSCRRSARLRSPAPASG